MLAHMAKHTKATLEAESLEPIIPDVARDAALYPLAAPRAAPTDTDPLKPPIFFLV
jgi:hypothetical protein